MQLSALFCALLLALPAAASADSDSPAKISTNGEMFYAPASPDQRDVWLAAMKAWRDEQRAKLKDDGSLYTKPELAWTQRTFVQPQMMCEDRYFYDPKMRRYTVDRYCDDLEARYGGIDSVLIWPVYSNIGIDNRSQHDLLRAMPGGLKGIRAMVQDFHKRGVHVLFPMMPWDVGTRQEGVTLAQTVARDFAEAGIDGVNGDTMNSVPREYLEECQKQNHLLGFEPECGVQLNELSWTTMSWGYWDYPPAPIVDLYKWLEPRHRSHACNRWEGNRMSNIQTAFFNGQGYESWENIWGIWNGITPRDGEALRRVSTVEHAVADYLVSPDWEPYVPTGVDGVYASKFPGKEGTVWLVVNRTDKNYDEYSGTSGVMPSVQAEVKPGMHYYDLWNGRPVTVPASGSHGSIGVSCEAHGFGAVIALRGEPSPKIKQLLARMAKLTQKPLASFSNKWVPLSQSIVAIAPTVPKASAPEGMVAIPAAKFHFKVRGVEIEGGDHDGLDFQYPWDSMAKRAHEHDVDVAAFYIDKFPVTNEQFKAFLTATKYHPADDYNFLKDWKGGAFPTGWAKKPVTWVSIEDARAYAKWAGKRLPHEWEWQYAAQGTDGRPYPWGAAPDDSAIPTPVKGHDLTGPDDVDAHPKGASPFGVMDLTGNVWQWTDEFQDEHTRAACVRGDSYYQPQGSNWYFPRNPTLDVHGKYLLMCPGKDRAGTLGFRCVRDGK